MATKQTKISAVEDVSAEPARAPRVGSMADCEKKHGTAPAVSPAEVKRKASKARIDSEAFGVEANDKGEPAAPPAAKK